MIDAPRRGGGAGGPEVAASDALGRLRRGGSGTAAATCPTPVDDDVDMDRAGGVGGPDEDAGSPRGAPGGGATSRGPVGTLPEPGGGRPACLAAAYPPEVLLNLPWRSVARPFSALGCNSAFQSVLVTLSLMEDTLNGIVVDCT